MNEQPGLEKTSAAEKKPVRIARLFLQISVDGVATTYRLKRTEPDPLVARSPTWRLIKLTEEGREGDIYDIHVESGIAFCTCGSATYRRNKVGQECKHAIAIRSQLGFI